MYQKKKNYYINSKQNFKIFRNKPNKKHSTNSSEENDNILLIYN